MEESIGRKLIGDLKKDIEFRKENNFERLFDEAKNHFEKGDLENALISMITLTNLLVNQEIDTNPKEKRLIRDLKSKSEQFIEEIRKGKS